MAAFLEPLCHHHQTLEGAARRTPLGRAESQPLDHPPRPLPVEIYRVQYHDPPVAPHPDRRENAPVPERADSRLAGVADLYGVGHPDNLEAQRRADEMQEPIRRPGDRGYLHPAPSRELGHSRPSQGELSFTRLRRAGY